jgi:hypothetical protein
MKAEMRRDLAREPFEEKIRKVDQLIQLSSKLKATRAAGPVERRTVTDSTFIGRGVRAHKNASRKMLAAERHFGIKRDPIIISAIRQKSVLAFSYNGKLRTVEPQTYGLSTSGREVLRAYERPAPNSAKGSGMAKLFDLAKISGLQKTGLKFAQALPTHNPDDSAMVEVFATLPRPKLR